MVMRVMGVMGVVRGVSAMVRPGRGMVGFGLVMRSGFDVGRLGVRRFGRMIVVSVAAVRVTAVRVIAMGVVSGVGVVAVADLRMGRLDRMSDRLGVVFSRAGGVMSFGCVAIISGVMGVHGVVIVSRVMGFRGVVIFSGVRRRLGVVRGLRRMGGLDRLRVVVGRFRRMGLGLVRGGGVPIVAVVRRLGVGFVRVVMRIGIVRLGFVAHMTHHPLPLDAVLGRQGV